jgi:hypothetical protein
MFLKDYRNDPCLRLFPLQKKPVHVVVIKQMLIIGGTDSPGISESPG